MKEETAKEMHDHLLKRRFHSSEFLRTLGVQQIPPLTTVIDTGFDPLTVESHLNQSAQLIAMLKIASAGWLIAEENAIRQKVAAARRYNIPAMMGTEVFILAHAKGRMDDLLELCADIGISRIEVDYFTVRSAMKPRDFAISAIRRELQFIPEITIREHGFSQKKDLDSLVDRAKKWLDAGASSLMLTSIERLPSMNTFSSKPTLNYKYVDTFAETFGLHTVIFDAPKNGTCKMLLDYFGQDVNLSGVRFGELFEVEAYRRGLHPKSMHSRSKRRLVTPRDVAQEKIPQPADKTEQQDHPKP